jgi:hypothetical protein
VLVGVALGGIVFGALTLTAHHAHVISTPAATTPPGWHIYHDNMHRIAISYPAPWRPSPSTLTPALVDPIVPIALGTYPLQPQRLGECDIVPQRALEALRPSDTFIAIYLYQGSATGNFSAQRPAHFGPHLPWFQYRTQCTQGVRGRVGNLTFTDNGRHLSILIAIGTKTTKQRQDQLYRILNTFKVNP